jgi:hypothetical protein
MHECNEPQRHRGTEKTEEDKKKVFGTDLDEILFCLLCVSVSLWFLL